MDLRSLVHLQLLEDDAGEFRVGAVDATSECGGIARSGISDKDNNDSAAGFEASCRTGAETRRFEGSEPLNSTRDDLAIGEDPTEGGSAMIEPEGDELRGQEVFV